MAIKNIISTCNVCGKKYRIEYDDVLGHKYIDTYLNICLDCIKENKVKDILKRHDSKFIDR